LLFVTCFSSTCGERKKERKKKKSDERTIKANFILFSASNNTAAIER